MDKCQEDIGLWIKLLLSWGSLGQGLNPDFLLVANILQDGNILHRGKTKTLPEIPPKSPYGYQLL